MRGRLQVIATDGTVTTIRDFLDEEPDLAALQKAVGGYIELVPYFQTWRNRGGESVPCFAFCDEHGKQKAHTVNSLATHLWRQQHRTHDYLAGPIAIVTGDGAFLQSMIEDRDE